MARLAAAYCEAMPRRLRGLACAISIALAASISAVRASRLAGSKVISAVRVAFGPSV